MAPGPRPERLRFHQATMDLLGWDSSYSDTSLALLERQEQRCGFSFPAAVREWYALEGAVALLNRYSNQDAETPLEQLGEEQVETGAFASEHAQSYPVVIVQHENQGVCRWGVLLDGSEDPPVLVEPYSGFGRVETGAAWRLYSERFSSFVYTRIWDWSSPFGDESACHLEAWDQPLSAIGLAYLQQRFMEAPRTYGWPALTTYRFAVNDMRLLIWDRDEPVGDTHTSHQNRPQHANWMLWASGPVTLTTLVEQVKDCGTLSRELFSPDDCGEAVIRQLFPGRPDPWDTRQLPAGNTDTPF